MDNQKITISLDEVNSSQVDAELHRQDVTGRMAEHQEKVRIIYGDSRPDMGRKSGIFRQSVVYMAVFGLIFSILGWAVSELFSPDGLRTNPFCQAAEAVDYLVKKYPDCSDTQLRDALQAFKEEVPEMKNNEYLPDKILNMSREEIDRTNQRLLQQARRNGMLWFLSLGLFISVGLSIAESLAAGNFQRALRNGLAGGMLGLVGGFLVSLFIDRIYNSLGGGIQTTPFIQQVFARSVGWGLLGLFMAIAPGITMKSPKKFLLGLIGGAIGGLLGGMLFDIAVKLTDGVVLSRFINIVGLGVGAAVATALLENAAKQGWLKVAAGLIAGKQFILYRNPTVIGSSPKCEIYLFKDPRIAPRHAAVNTRNGEFIITAIGESPVYVNGQTVGQHPLKTGDRIAIGDTLFVFEAKVLPKA